MRKCPKCKELKPPNGYYADVSRGPGGRHRWCRACVCAYMRARYWAEKNGVK